MRRFLVVLAPLLAWTCLYGMATPAHAESYPVCLAGGPANAIECDYANLAQCQATASGGVGYCITNPGYTLRAYASYRSAGKRMH
ncbi:DUF3551 domain-containing protein [Bradyrhizobium sp. USDA 10063]